MHCTIAISRSSQPTKTRVATDITGLLAAISAGLEALADVEKAPQMARHMKTEMPFFGVAQPARTRLANRSQTRN